MHTLLNRFFSLAMEAVHRYEGTVNQFLGDGFMALFGAPLAHEDHARRAALASLAIRRSLDTLHSPDADEIRVRMGLNTGPVIVGSIGDNLRMDYTAVGDTTNLAARLQQHAEPGSILVSDSVATQISGYAVLEPVPQFNVKGKDSPLAAFRLMAADARRSRLSADRLRSPFVGRDREVDVLLEALLQVEEGRGQVVSIVGEPGVGKSRVLYELRARLASLHFGYIEGWCQSFGQAMPYLPLQDLLRSMFAIAESDDEKAIQALAALDVAPHSRYRSWALTASAWSCGYMGKWDLAIERCQQAMREGEELSDVSVVSFGAWILGVAYVLKCDIEKAIYYSKLSTS